eukprot:4302494-Pyramimonas_sp.AAC.1
MSLWNRCRRTTYTSSDYDAIAPTVPPQAIMFAQSRSNQPQLLDLVARPQNEEDSDEEEQAGARPSKRRAIYRDHLPLSELERGMREGRYHQGTLRTNRYDSNKASVSSESAGASIHIKGA